MAVTVVMPVRLVPAAIRVLTGMGLTVVPVAPVAMA
jgi:hypothetical protein